MEIPEKCIKSQTMNSWLIFKKNESKKFETKIDHVCVDVMIYITKLYIMI